MAERRMFARTILESDAFMDLPDSSKVLYVYLCMSADDDGCCNSPRAVMRFCGAREDDVRLLITKKFILAFDSGIVVIKHWKLHNYIRSDRYHASKYRDLLQGLYLDDNKAYTLEATPVRALSAGIPADCQALNGPEWESGGIPEHGPQGCAGGSLTDCGSVEPGAAGAGLPEDYHAETNTAPGGRQTGDRLADSGIPNGIQTGDESDSFGIPDDDRMGDKGYTEVRVGQERSGEENQEQVCSEINTDRGAGEESTAAESASEAVPESRAGISANRKKTNPLLEEMIVRHLRMGNTAMANHYYKQARELGCVIDINEMKRRAGME